jgi:hypothetical protein
MANTPISGLNPGVAISDTDLFPDVQTVGIGPVRVTASQIKTYTSNSPVLVTPNIGVATGTSLALGGAAIGSNALAVTGTVDFNGAVTLGTQQSIQGSLVLSNTAAGAYETTLRSSNSSSVAWTFTLPPNAGTNGFILTTNGSGVSAWTNPTALGIDIDVNSTAITGGVSGRLVYDNAGTFGEISAITTNGSGALTIGSQQTTQGSIVLGNTASGAFSTTIQSSNSSSAAWTLTLPTTAGTSNYVLTTNGSGVSSWSQVSLTAGVTGILPLANGGTNANLTASNGGIFYSNATAGAILSGTATAGQHLQSGANSAPSWTTATFPSTATGTGSILRADGTNWTATTATYPNTTAAGTVLVSATASAITASSSPTLGVQQTTQGSLVLANTAAGAFATTVNSSNSSTEAWTLTLPPNKGTNGYILTTNGSGVSSWTNPTALGIDLDVNTTPITNGTAGRLLFEGAGNVLQESANLTFSSSTLTLGVASSATGSVALTGATSGTATITAQAVAGTPTLTLPTASGTLVSTATSPLSINATSGDISITGLAGGVLAGSTPAFTATPTLGVAGTTVGTIAFANATSGSITLSPATGALGSSTITIPATTGTMTVLGNSTTGSGNIVLGTSPSLTTPSLGVATGTSLNINGATLGTNNLAVVGTSFFNGSVGIGANALSFTQFYVNSSSNINARFERQSGAAVDILAQSTLGAIGTANSNPFLFYTNGSESARIDQNKNFVINTAAIATNATNGFLYIPSCAGTPTGVPTTYTGRLPIVYDSTNNMLYIYNGGWKSATFT